MKTTVALNGSTCALCDLKEPVLLPETLEIEFTSSVYKLSNLVLLITAKNGDVKKQFKAHSKNNYTIDLKELLFLGEIELEISACIKATAVKSWRVPGIFVKEIEHNIEAIPEIESLKEEISLLNKAILELNKKIENIGV